MSPDFDPLRDAIFPTRGRENGLFNEKPSTKAIFPFSRGKNRISQGVENRGSLISVPLALRVNASRQKLTPHCLATIFDSRFPSPKLSLKLPPKLPLPHKTGHFFCFRIAPAVRAIMRQLRGNNCLAAIFASRHVDASLGPLGSKTRGK